MQDHTTEQSLGVDPARRPQFTESFGALPALKDTVFDAPLAMGSPVRGFRPVRAGRLFAENVPNPAMVTLSPHASAMPNRCRIPPPVPTIGMKETAPCMQR